MKNLKKTGIVLMGLITIKFTGLAAYQPVTVQSSVDRHIDYIKDYVGTNLASFGYTAMDGKRRDYYGNGNIKLVFLTDAGEFIDPQDIEALKNYVVVDQSVDPNTEIKLEYEKKENEEEYENLVNFISCDEILLKVRKIDETAVEKENSLTRINTSPDKYTAYMKDYVGRNLADCGYISLGGQLRDEYACGTVQIIPVSENGAFIDITDEDIIRKYVVTSQNIEPNTEILFTFLKNEEGEEYSNLIDTQSCSEIQLRVKNIG